MPESIEYGLLDTILADADILSQLSELPDDAKTMTLELQGRRASLSHPNWSAITSFGDSSLADSLASFSSPDAVDVTRASGDTSLSPEAFSRELEQVEGFIPHRVVTFMQGALPSSDQQTSASSRETIADPKEAVANTEYRFFGKLGAGGTGVVYQAHQRAVDREVAIKVLRDELAKDPVARHRFLTEARVIGSLDHPNVISLHDLCLDEQGHLFYSMKRVDGASWDEEISKREENENIETLLRVGDAIRYAHSRGVIHRDIKPENVMLGRFGEVLVADWGLAVGWDARQGAQPITLGSRERFQPAPAIGGTPAYMAPEQARGLPGDISPATDVYLLGAILYRVLTGYAPHRGDSLLACIQAAADNTIRPTDVTGELIEIALHAMATDPQDRFPSVEALASAIEGQRTHEQSNRLVRRAERRLGEIDPAAHEGDDNPYEPFALADALIREALEVWPENKKAQALLRRSQVDFAGVAAKQGDLDLAIKLYEVAGHGESEAAARVRLERDQRERVQSKHAKYSALFMQSPEAGILVRLEDGVLLESNAAFERLIAYSKGELVGQPMGELSIWRCPHRRQEFVERIRRDRSIDNFEAQFVRRDGQAPESPHASADPDVDDSCDDPDRVRPVGVVDVLISSRVVHVDGQDVMLSTIRDISARKDAERRIQQSRQRMRDFQRLAGLGTWSFSTVAQKVTWSDETFALMGRDAALGEPGYDEFLNLIHPEDRSMVDRTIQNAKEQGASYHMGFRVDRGDGFVWLSARGEPVMDEDGNVIELYGVLMQDHSPS
ncbi:MAG: protein kinase [Planctomycetota bacterium]